MNKRVKTVTVVDPTAVVAPVAEVIEYESGRVMWHGYLWA